MPRSLAEIRARAAKHEEEILAMRWFTPAQLAARWGYKSPTTVYAIPLAELRYKEFGSGEKLKRRRYREDWVIAYEESQPGGVPTETPAVA